MAGDGMYPLKSGYRRALQIAGDGALLAISLVLSFGLRFDFRLPPQYTIMLVTSIAPLVGLKVSLLYAFGAYHRMWRYASMGTLNAIIRATTISSIAAVVFTYLIQTLALPRSVLAIDWLLSIIVLGGARFFGRSLEELRLYVAMPESAKRVLICGAGDAGEVIVREMLKNRSLGYVPVGFVDDDPGKRWARIHGVRVAGRTDELEQVYNSRPADEVIIAMPSASREVKRKIVMECERLNVPCRTLPGVYEILDGRVDLNQIRNVEVEDILGREPVRIDLNQVSAYLSGKRILVTGAAGSIGSELCRQIGPVNPAELILLDQSESGLFAIEQELNREHTFAPFSTVICDVKNEEAVNAVFRTHRPDVVFHAAAYKHVPMMEKNPLAALENNFIGTRVVSDAAKKWQAERFVLISTDKAVRPKNVMGLSKALAEKVVLAMPEGKTKFMIVRFGNVLASNGSVVPIFKEQIARGGPVTVTHKEMKRYFMTIPEAIQLVVQAGAFGTGGEVFVLDMGEKVFIRELAENMIRLSGFEPYSEIPIEYIGIRPGEKLEEELLRPSEKRLPTENDKIYVATREGTNKVRLAAALREVETLSGRGDVEKAVAIARSLDASDEVESQAPLST